MSNSYVSDRAIFPTKESQVNFILAIKKIRKIKWKDLSEEWNVNVRTLSSWKNGTKNMPYDLAVCTSKRFGIPLPKDIRRQTWKEHARAAGAKGAKMNVLKNGKIGGDPEKRKEKWLEWWNDIGQYKEITILQSKEILLPSRNKELAEFIGIMLGDGSIAQYHVKISLHKKEIEYVKFISKLIKKLFGVTPKIYPSKISEGVDVVVQRKRLVDFLHTAGLPIGNKIRQGVDIPSWIMENSIFQKSCIRGLMDTDGSFFNHSYISHGRKYNYTKIDFTSVSKPLLKSAYTILINLGFSVRICRNEKAIRIENQKDVFRYIKMIGTNNPRYGQNQSKKMK